MIEKIPGFRSGTGWKMILAMLGYGFVITMVIAHFAFSPPIETEPTTLPAPAVTQPPPPPTTVRTPAPAQPPSTPVYSQSRT